MDLNININIKPSKKILKLLRTIGENMHQDYLDLAKKIDQATNAVAARIAALSDKVKNSMTDEEVAEVKAAFQAEADRLTVLAKDPSDPIPE